MMNDFRYALRLLRRSPGFTAVAVLVLALGIGANTAAFSVVNALLLQPRPGRIDSLVALFNRDRTKPGSYHDFSYPAYVDLRERSGVFDSLMAHTFTTVGVREGDATRRSFATLVSANYFSTLGVPLAAGRAFTPEEERPGSASPVVIASYSAWRRTGFDPAFVGKTVRVSNLDATIVGVAPQGFGGTMTIVALEWWFPLGLYDSIMNDMFKPNTAGLTDRSSHILNLAGRVKSGASMTSVDRALDAFSARLGADFPGSDRDRQFVAGRLPRLGVSSQPDNETELSLVSSLLLGMAGLVLIVACLNLANLLLARGTSRRREIAVRQALGSGRARIVRQLVIEGLTLSCAGAAVGLSVAWWTTGALSAWLATVAPLGIEIYVEPSARLFVAAAAGALLSTLLFALGPAWVLSRSAATADLKGLTVSQVRKIGTGPVLIAGQLAVSLALVAGGGLFVRAALKAASADPGFALERQLIFGLDASVVGYDEPRTRGIYRTVLDRIGSFPGVERVAFASTVPFGELSEGREVHVPGVVETYHPQFVIVSSSYFEALRLDVVRGRGFTAADDERPTSAAPIPAVVDVALARRIFSGADPIGRQIRISLREATPPVDFEIVGVVPTLRHDLFESDPRGHVYSPYGSQFRANMNLHVRVAPGMDERAMLASIRRELQRVDGNLPVLTARTMTMHRDASFSEWAVRTAAALFSTFGVLALLIAAIGVYGLKAYEVTRRTREIGIRQALGATDLDVVWLILRDGVPTACAGLAIGILLAFGAGKAVSGLLYQVSPFDPGVLTSAVLVLLTAAALACYLPARRATRIEPLEALRIE